MRSDCHVHLRGPVDPDKVLASLDENGIEKAVLMGQRANTIEEQQASDDYLSKLCSADPVRLLGFARIDPRLEGMRPILGNRCHRG